MRDKTGRERERDRQRDVLREEEETREGLIEPQNMMGSVFKEVHTRPTRPKSSSGVSLYFLSSS